MKSGISEMFAAGFAKFKNYLKARYAYLSDVDAEDIVQQTALSLLGRDDDDSIEYLTAYVYASLRNRAKNMFREKSKEILTNDIAQGRSSSAEDELVEKELNEQIDIALSMLDEASRFVFEKTEFEGLSYKELSEMTGEPVGTLLSRKNRAAKKLMIILDEYRKL